MHEWRSIESFPGYSVSDEGQVRNEDSGKIMSLLVNQYGVANVSLTRNRVQHKRSVSLLVCQAFHPKRPGEAFNTPINLNGDRLDNHACNLVWRPRWFAVKYFRQFKTEPVGIKRPIEEVDTEERFPTSWDAALKYGLLDLEILLAIVNHTHVWPTYQHFRVLN